MTNDNRLNTPWTLRFERDGTEDVGVIVDADGDELVRSRHFWLPDHGDPSPPTLCGLRLMADAPRLLSALERFASQIEIELDPEVTGPRLAAALAEVRTVLEAAGGEDE